MLGGFLPNKEPEHLANCRCVQCMPVKSGVSPSDTQSTNEQGSTETVSAITALEELLSEVYRQEEWWKQEEHINKQIEINWPGK